MGWRWGSSVITSEGILGIAIVAAVTAVPAHHSAFVVQQQYTVMIVRSVLIVGELEIDGGAPFSRWRERSG